MVCCCRYVGGLADYWDKFWDPQYPRLQGGFIWDFVDQGLVLGKSEFLCISFPVTTIHSFSNCGGSHPLGKRTGCYGYGGDFGDVPNTKQFCINGILGPNRVPHPIAFEAAALQCPVGFSLLVEGDAAEATVYLLIKNKRSFTDLSDIVLSISLGCDNAPIDDDCYSMSIALKDHPCVAAGSEQKLDVSFIWSEMTQNLLRRREQLLDNESCGLPCRRKPREVWLEVTAYIATEYATQFIPARHELTCVTLAHPSLVPFIEHRLTASGYAFEMDEGEFVRNNRDSLSIHHSLSACGDVVVEWGNGNTAMVGGECGRLLSWAVGGTEILSSPMDMCFWRAPTDNDMYGMFVILWRLISNHCLSGVAEISPIISNGSRPVSTD